MYLTQEVDFLQNQKNNMNESNTWKTKATKVFKTPKFSGDNL